MKVRWTTSARRELLSAYGFVRESRPRTAVALVRRIGESAERLGRHPLAGRVGRILGTHELPISRTPYIIVYEVTESELIIVRLLHAAQQWPAESDPSS